MSTANASHFDGITAAGSNAAEYSSLGESSHGHAPKHHGSGAVKITRMAKIVFGIGFCSENMFDVAGDTLLTKFYSGMGAGMGAVRAGAGAG